MSRYTHPVSHPPTSITYLQHCLIISCDHLSYLPGGEGHDLPPPDHPGIVRVTGVVYEGQGGVQTHSYPHYLGEYYIDKEKINFIVQQPYFAATYLQTLEAAAWPALSELNLENLVFFSNLV